MEALTKPDFLRLLAVAKKASERDWLMLLLHFWHAGRASEIVDLTRDNFVGSFIKFDRGKGSESCDQALVEHKNPLLNERAAVFAYLQTVHGKQKLFPMSRTTYWRHFRRHAAAAGIDPGVLRFNGTRALKHCIGTYMIEKAPVNAVQRRMGHVNGANTLRYAKLRENQVDELVADSVGIS